MILVIDNYDSFVYNIARYIAMLGKRTQVVRSDSMTIADIEKMRPDAIIISPGPCTPEQAGISNAIVRDLSGRVPVLGVCLGHQCIGSLFGGQIAHARRPLHGQTSQITHAGRGLFASLPSPLPVGRYHSLIVQPTPEMEATLSIDAVSEEGEIMALSHKHHPTYGVQFHPESVLTPQGRAIFGNFLALAKARMPDAVA